MNNNRYIFANYIPVGIDKQYHWVNNITDNAVAAQADFKSLPAALWTQLTERRSYIPTTPSTKAANTSPR
ncbi:MAG: hypothetical protein LBK76_04395 [Verrucomicrobiales bacterium]|jgi:hypothetical protein|nr:hypothetical protein [Verrucomicrobiales bacterium]